MQPIESSLFDARHYDGNARKLTLRFRNGTVYEYDDVPAEKHAALIENASPGRYYNEKIKRNFKGRKIG
jgi:hypothetical protein